MYEKPESDLAVPATMAIPLIAVPVEPFRSKVNVKLPGVHFANIVIDAVGE